MNARERPSALRSALLALGFLGVMLVVKPGFGATPGMGFALLADGFAAALGLRALAGLGLAGTYIPGLRALVDRLSGPAREICASPPGASW